MRHHVLLDVSCHQRHFFTRIKDIQWIENLFGARKKLEHPRAKHEREIRGADEAVVVLPRRRAMIADDQLIAEMRKWGHAEMRKWGQSRFSRL